MTAEIAIMNKLAVTLAADSAVTIGSGEATKVYNSADKIFEGTNHDPIAIMVYNSPELNGVPIEAIVKMYRDQHCNQSFTTVFEYAKAFLNHLENMKTPEFTIKNSVQSLVLSKIMSMYNLMRQVADEFFRAVGSGEREVAQDRVIAALEEDMLLLLEVEALTLEDRPVEAWSFGLDAEMVFDAHAEALSEVVDALFSDDPLASQMVKDKIVRIAVLSLVKEYEKPLLTGLVFAGFGRDEIFPSLIAYEVYGLVAGKLKYRETNRFDVDRQLTPDATIIPFAQREMVDRFMYGLDGEFIELASTYFAGALTKLKTGLGQLLDGNEAIREAITPAIDLILDEFQNVVVSEHLTRSRTQLSDMVRSMPKQELAALCESLIHITSLKRKFSAGAESVGGPIDVAMITRSEGFVWVKRKHYFEPVLNPRYFHRRYSGRYDGSAPQAAAAAADEGAGE